MTTIGASITITGEVTSREDVTIFGSVKGKITMEGGSLMVAQSGAVQAEAQVSRAVIHGSFTGDVAAAERVELSNSSNVNGTLVAPAVVMQDGAVFNGLIEVTGKKKARVDRVTETLHAKAS